MKTPEEIKRGLERCRLDDSCENGCPYHHEGCGDEMRKDALTYIKALETAQPKWISVNERLPEACEDGFEDAVLVTDGFLIHIAYCVDEMWLFCESGEMKEPMFYEVTHWMPLPEPPKEEDNENA